MMYFTCTCIYLIVYHGAEFMYVRMQLAFSYTLVLCLPLKKRETVTIYVSFNGCGRGTVSKQQA